MDPRLAQAMQVDAMKKTAESVARLEEAVARLEAMLIAYGIADPPPNTEPRTAAKGK